MSSPEIDELEIILTKRMDEQDKEIASLKESALILK